MTYEVLIVRFHPRPVGTPASGGQPHNQSLTQIIGRISPSGEPVPYLKGREGLRGRKTSYLN